MEDYFRTLAELDSLFPTEEACRGCLFTLRRPDGFRWPCCLGAKAWLVGSRSHRCAGCSNQATVTAGTIFHRTRIPLAVWFRAMSQVVIQKNGARGLGLKSAIGLGSYETA